MSWSPQEEQMLKVLKSSPENLNWTVISKKLSKLFKDKYHTAKQCRERYINYVKYEKNNAKFLTWSQQEEDLLYELYEKIGSNWNTISQSFDFKSENTIKNKFYGGLRKLLRRLNSIGKAKRRLKKQLRYQSFVRPLEIAKYTCKQSQIIQMAISLRTTILCFLKTGLTDLTEEVGIQFIEKINKFNLLSRSMSKKKNRNLEQNQGSNVEGSSHQNELLLEKQEIQVNDYDRTLYNHPKRSNIIIAGYGKDMTWNPVHPNFSLFSPYSVQQHTIMGLTTHTCLAQTGGQNIQLTLHKKSSFSLIRKQQNY